MSFEKVWNEQPPMGNESIRDGDNVIRDFKTAIRERLAVEHTFVADEDDVPNVGSHKPQAARLLMGNVEDRPTWSASFGSANGGLFFYAKDEKKLYVAGAEDWEYVDLTAETIDAVFSSIVVGDDGVYTEEGDYYTGNGDFYTNTGDVVTGSGNVVAGGDVSANMDVIAGRDVVSGGDVVAGWAVVGSILDFPEDAGTPEMVGLKGIAPFVKPGDTVLYSYPTPFSSSVDGTSTKYFFLPRGGRYRFKAIIRTLEEGYTAVVTVKVFGVNISVSDTTSSTEGAVVSLDLPVPVAFGGAIAVTISTYDPEHAAAEIRDIEFCGVDDTEPELIVADAQ